MCGLYETIEMLCMQEGIKPGKLAREIGMQPSVISDLKNGRTKELSMKNLGKIADYFHVSIDSLRGKENTPQAEAQGDQTSEIPEDYAMLNEGNKQFVNEMIARLLAGQSQPAQGPDSQP